MFLVVFLLFVTSVDGKAIFSSYESLSELLRTENALIDLAHDYLETASTY